MEISEAQIKQASLSVIELKILELCFLNNGRALIDPSWLHKVFTFKYHNTAVPVAHSVKSTMYDHPVIFYFT